MLPKQNRLHLRTEFKSLRASGKMIGGRFFGFLYQSSTASQPEFAFIVSKKIDTRAVVRNKIRRQLSEAVKELIPGLKPVKGVFLVKKPATEATFGELRSEIERIFRQAGLFM